MIVRMKTPHQPRTPHTLLELRHLRTLDALRQAGSLVRAAGLLGLTQSALSHQLKLLEEHYGASLFERKSVPIEFTGAGRQLLALADLVLLSVEQVERALQAAAASARVGAAGEADWLAPVVRAYRLRWPEPAPAHAALPELGLAAPALPGFAPGAPLHENRPQA
jgi:LysR family transcriptional regulator for metE and metH